MNSHDIILFKPDTIACESKDTREKRIVAEIASATPINLPDAVWAVKTLFPGQVLYFYQCLAIRNDGIGFKIRVLFIMYAFSKALVRYITTPYTPEQIQKQAKYASKFFKKRKREKSHDRS